MKKNLWFSLKSVLLGIVLLIVPGLLSDSVLSIAHLPEVFSTDAGERRTLRLEDGSYVDLNSRTRLEASVDAVERRIVLRKGEALFDVRPEAARPFCVTVGNTEIRVLGTRFNVYRKPNDNVELDVLEGLVQVRGFVQGSGRQEWVRRVKAGQKAEYGPSGVIDEPHSTDQSRMAGWRSQTIWMSKEGLPMSALVEELNRYTDKKIVIGDSRLSTLSPGGQSFTTDPRRAMEYFERLMPIKVVETADAFILNYDPKSTQRVRDRGGISP